MNDSLGMVHLSGGQGLATQMHDSLGLHHLSGGSDTESAEKYTFVSLEPGFHSPLKLQCSLGAFQFECRKKQATQMQIIYILDSGLDSGLIQFIYWIRALIRA